METDLLFQIAAVGMIVAILNLVLNKSDHSEQALMVTIAGLVLVLILVVNEISELFDTLRSAFGL